MRLNQLYKLFQALGEKRYLTFSKSFRNMKILSFLFNFQEVYLTTEIFYLNLIKVYNSLKNISKKFIVDILLHIVSRDINIARLNLDLSNVRYESSEIIYIFNTIPNLNKLIDLSLVIYNSDLENVLLPSLLAKTKCIQSFDCNFRLNFIEDKTLIYLILSAFQNLNSLTSLKLNISTNNIKDDGMKQISESLSKLINLTYLNLDIDSNKISDQGVSVLAEALQNLKNVSSIHVFLWMNIITGDGLANFTNGLKCLTNIVSLTLDFNNNYISPDTIELRHLKSLKNMRYFTLDVPANKQKNSIMISLSELFK